MKQTLSMCEKAIALNEPHWLCLVYHDQDVGLSMNSTGRFMNVVKSRNYYHGKMLQSYLRLDPKFPDLHLGQRQFNDSSMIDHWALTLLPRPRKGENPAQFSRRWLSLHLGMMFYQGKRQYYSQERTSQAKTHRRCSKLYLPLEAQNFDSHEIHQ